MLSRHSCSGKKHGEDLVVKQYTLTEEDVDHTRKSHLSGIILALPTVHSIYLPIYMKYILCYEIKIYMKISNIHNSR